MSLLTTRNTYVYKNIRSYLYFESSRTRRSGQETEEPAIYTYTYACRCIFNTIKTSGHNSLEKYTSHFIERVVCERDLETEQRLQHVNLINSSGYHSLSFPFSWAAHPGSGGPAPAVTWFSFQHLFSN